MNPFDYTGPVFLVFFGVLGAVLAAVVTLVRRSQEPDQARDDGVPPDPYEIAYLRGGRNHVMQVALVALMDRGLLQVQGKKLKTADAKRVLLAQRALDKAILTKCLWAMEASELYQDEHMLLQAEATGERLRELGLLPDGARRKARLTLFAVAAAFLWLVAGIKIAVAISRGRYNLMFLVLLGMAFVAVLYKVTNPFRTRAGEAVMGRIRETFAGLYKRRGSLPVHGETNELTFLAAAFGLGALPAAMAKEIKPLKLHPASSSGCGSGCSGGSSCGGGSGCGGGGGCGGCGS